jgi:hypothetical protein
MVSPPNPVMMVFLKINPRVQKHQVSGVALPVMAKAIAAFLRTCSR